MNLLLAAILRRRHLIVTVEGWSMYPALSDGDRLLVRRCDGTGPGVVPGAVLLVARPDGQRGWSLTAEEARRRGSWILKRAHTVAGASEPGLAAGSVYVVGDHPRSEDSKQHGFCPPHLVAGVVLRRVSAGTATVPASVLATATARVPTMISATTEDRKPSR